MNKIHPLPDTFIAKIAAGEVIERPAYAVKELLENSLDAKATRVYIDLEQSGLKRIIVRDNGEGMSRGDILECYKPHTTSKIDPAHDLLGITTLGFRGEALSSIVAISNVIIKSKTADEKVGTEVEIANGTVQNINSIGLPTGTEITITDLFSTTPARKKFLQHGPAEFKHILEIVTNYALIYPALKFTLVHNKRTVFDVPQNQDLSQRVQTLLGKSVYQKFLPIEYKYPHIEITGFIAHPHLYSSSHSKQYLFVNNRSVFDRTLSSTVKNAYGSLLDPTKYPIFLLSLTLPYEMVDVNVHPRKEHIKLLDERRIYDNLQQSIKDTLQTNNLTYKNIQWDHSKKSFRSGHTKSLPGELLKEKITPWQPSTPTELLSKEQILQIQNTYLLVPTKIGVLLVDQHAAHERVLYEQFLAGYKKQRDLLESYDLPDPMLIDFSITEKEMLITYNDLFIQSGFEIDHLKDTTFIIRKVPIVFKGRDYALLINELIDNFVEEKTPQLDRITHIMISFLACRSAIMAGDPLTKKQAQNIIKLLENTPNNATCPHGRPTKVELDIEIINKAFKR